MRTYVAATLMLFATSASCQNIYLVGEVNYSTFGMNDMKSIQQDFISKSGLPLNAVDQFPSYIGFGGIAAFEWHQFSFGLQGGYTSTGGRADYEDYSGVARFDQTIKCYWVGPYFQYRFVANSSWIPFVNFRSSYIRTNLDLNTLLEVGSSVQTGETSLHSRSYGFRPELGVSKNLKKVLFQFTIGYELQIHGKLYSDSNSSAYLLNGSGSPAGAEWDGLRASFGVGIFISKHE